METKSTQYQMPIFIIGLLLFAVIAYFGWIKLQYGFNFIDEGYHATESWRLAAGDHFLDDKITGGLALYTLISSIIFKIYPDITLLQFRQLQFLLTLSALFIFSIALFRQSRQYAWLPFAFFLFAFTGLDPNGMISNLYYQTYPHLFLVLHLSFMLFAVQAQKIVIKKSFFLLSGFCLWLISFSLLHLSVIMLSPVILFILFRGFRPKNYFFSFNDLVCILLPFITCWAIFIAVFNKAYLLNILANLDLTLSLSASSGGLLQINWEVIKHIAASISFLMLFFVAIKKLSAHLFIAGCAILAVTMLLMINTSLFGLVTPYWNGWLAKPMWFSSLLMAFAILFWICIIKKLIFKNKIKKEEALAIILMLPFTLCAGTMSLFSGLGALSVCQNAIPAVAAISLIVTGHVKNSRYPHLNTITAIILLLGPFYYTTARHDWNFTFFDVPPEQANVQIQTGFGKGIYTNPLYAKLYDWLTASAAAYTRPGDFAVSYVVSPMVHMITRLRPSLDDTFVTFQKPHGYFEKCIEKMKQNGRHPKIAFVFERMPILIPVSTEEGEVTMPGKQFDFMSSPDPISSYVRANMTPGGSFKISEDYIIRCYVNQHLNEPHKSTSLP